MLLFIILASLLSTVLAKSYPTVYYMNSYCGSSIYVQNEVRVTLTSQNYLNANQECKLTLTPFTGSKLVATFLNYSLSNYNYYDSSGNCQYESVQMTADGAKEFGYRGYCGYTVPYGQYDVGRTSTISVSNLQQYSYILAPNIDVLFSEVFTKYSDNTCPYEKFDCQYSGNCIDNSLTCNGFNDCGNNLDETLGCRDPNPHFDIQVNLPAIIGGSVGLVVLISGIVFTVVICRRRGKKGGYVQF